MYRQTIPPGMTFSTSIMLSRSSSARAFVCDYEQYDRYYKIYYWIFKSKDPKAPRKWYDENLGIKDDPQGHLFEWIDKDDHSTTGVTVWSHMSAATEYLGKPEQQFMINYRVENLEKLAKELFWPSLSSVSG